MATETVKKLGVLRIATKAFVAAIAAALLLGLVGYLLVGQQENIELWRHWREGKYLPLLTWRLCLYGAIATCWLLMKARMPQNQEETQQTRIEILFIGLIILLESGKAAMEVL